MKKHAESHFDHGLTADQVDFLMKQFADRTAFFIATVELPEQLGTAPCGLHGPIVGDAPIAEADVTYVKRGTRAWNSRLVDRPMKPSRTVTVIAGPHEELCPVCNGKGTYSPMAKMDNQFMPGDVIRCDYNRYLPGQTGCVNGKLQHACIIYTMFGGPLSPQEPGDVRAQIQTLERTRRAYHPELNMTDEQEAEIHAKIIALREKRDASDKFWSEHALTRES